MAADDAACTLLLVTEADATTKRGIGTAAAEVFLDPAKVLDDFPIWTKSVCLAYV